MKSHQEEEEKKNEDKIGVIPVSEIKGSDADNADPNQSDESDKQAEQAKGTDADANT